MGMIAQFIRLDDNKLQTVIDDPSSLRAFFDTIDYDAGMIIDIDKMWSAIQFMLVGDPFSGDMPLGFIMSGPPIGDVDMGMGPALSKRATVVKEIAAALEPIDEAEFTKRFDHDAMKEAEVYAMDGHPADDLFCVVDSYLVLREFILKAAEADEGLIHLI